MTVVYISIGAAIGATLRYFVGLWAAQQFGAAFPYGTMIVNVTGSFALGLILFLTSNRSGFDPAWHLVLAVGLCGGYTTFSTYSAEIVALLREGMIVLAGVYALVSIILGVLAMAAGAYLMQLVSGE